MTVAAAGSFAPRRRCPDLWLCSTCESSRAFWRQCLVAVIIMWVVVIKRNKQGRITNRINLVYKRFLFFKLHLPNWSHKAGMKSSDKGKIQAKTVSKAARRCVIKVLYRKGWIMAMYRSTVIAHKFQIEVKMASIATRWGISVLQSAIFLQKKSVGKKSSPTEKFRYGKGQNEHVWEAVQSAFRSYQKNN